MSTYHTGFGNGLDGAPLNDMGYQVPENQCQWQFNGTGNGTAVRQNTFGPQGIQNTDILVSMVAGASEALLERNAFYVGLKTVASNQVTEIEGLKGTVKQKILEIIGCDKEIGILKVRCETLEEMIGRFAREYHTLKGTGSNEGQFLFLTVGPMPTPWKRDEHPKVTLWLKREWICAAKASALAQKGESSGDSSDVTKMKAKVGRPSKKDEDEEGHKYLYLQGRDGVPISVEKLRTLSNKARSVWEFLLSKKMAPPQFGKMEWPAWDLYTCTMLTDPELDFLLLCNDVTWKLWEWSTQNYSSWAGNRGIRPKNASQNTGKDEDTLDNPALIRMKSSDGMDDSNDSIQPADRVSESNGIRNEEMTPESEVAGFLEADNKPEENPRPSTQLPQEPIQSVIANPFAPTASSLSSGTQMGAVTTNQTPITPVSATLAQTPKDSANTTQTHTNIPGEALTAVTPENQPVGTTSHNTAESIQHTGTTPPDRGSVTTTTDGTVIPPRPQIILKLNPLAKSTVTQENQDPATQLEPTWTPGDGPSNTPNPILNRPSPAPVDAPIPNLRLETATALAEPTSMITIRNICMRQWNKKQLGGQGLAADFDAYYKGLSDADKEPFKKETRTAQAATRRAKTASKKPSKVPSVN
ncbi:hypothetical protein H4582DRAFT_2078585 [Lactarius indigo]|nr:hypothetical protein H4582DRAFT_2078585 [Lactarius indigo]